MITFVLETLVKETPFVRKRVYKRSNNDLLEGEYPLGKIFVTTIIYLCARQLIRKLRKNGTL